jgi:hypothetical protein
MDLTKRLFKKSLLGIYATRILKGALFLLTILVTISTKDMSNQHIITYILLAYLAMVLIDVYCKVIGEQIRFMKPMPAEEIKGFVMELLPELIPGIIGALIFSLAALRLISHKAAFLIMEIGCIVLVVFFCYASQRLSGRRGWKAVWPTMVATFMGCCFVFLRGMISAIPSAY